MTYEEQVKLLEFIKKQCEAALDYCTIVPVEALDLITNEVMKYVESKVDRIN